MHDGHIYGAYKGHLSEDETHAEDASLFFEDDEDPAANIFDHDGDQAVEGTVANHDSIHASFRVASASFANYKNSNADTGADGNLSFARQPVYEKLPVPKLKLKDADGNDILYHTKRTWYEPLFWFLTQLRWGPKTFSDDLGENATPRARLWSTS